MTIHNVTLQWEGDTCEVSCLDCGETWVATASTPLRDALPTHACGGDDDPFAAHCVWGRTPEGTPFHAALRPNASPEDWAAIQSVLDVVHAEIASGRLGVTPKDGEKARMGPKPSRVVPIRRGRPGHDR